MILILDQLMETMTIFLNVLNSQNLQYRVHTRLLGFLAGPPAPDPPPGILFPLLLLPCSLGGAFLTNLPPPLPPSSPPTPPPTGLKLLFLDELVDLDLDLLPLLETVSLLLPESGPDLLLMPPVPRSPLLDLDLLELVLVNVSVLLLVLLLLMRLLDPLPPPLESEPLESLSPPACFRFLGLLLLLLLALVVVGSRESSTDVLE